MLNRLPRLSETASTMISPLYRRPASLDEALRLLADGGSTVIAGCTLYFLDGRNHPLTDRLIDITGVAELQRIEIAADHVRIGPLVTWSQLAETALPVECVPLQQAARRIGALQIQNVGTLGGNLCGAAATADGIPPLLIVDASVELQALGGRRTLPLTQFLLGHRQTAREPDELLTAVIVPRQSGSRPGVFLKLARRAYQGIALVSVAAWVVRDDAGMVATAAVAVGACAAVAQRLAALEGRLKGTTAGRPLDPLFDPDIDLAALTPATDTLATAEYRRDAASTLVRRALQGLS